MYGSYQVARLPDITEEVIYTIHILELLIQVGYQMVTKLYRENVWKLPSYQVTRYYWESNMYNPSLIWLLQAGYQMVTKLYSENVWKLLSYQVTRYNLESNMYNPHLSIAVTSQLPNGYQAL